MQLKQRISIIHQLKKRTVYIRNKNCKLLLQKYTAQLLLLLFTVKPIIHSVFYHGNYVKDDQPLARLSARMTRL